MTSFLTLILFVFAQVVLKDHDIFLGAEAGGDLRKITATHDFVFASLSSMKQYVVGIRENSIDPFNRSVVLIDLASNDERLIRIRIPSDLKAPYSNYSFPYYFEDERVLFVLVSLDMTNSVLIKSTLEGHASMVLKNVNAIYEPRCGGIRRAIIVGVGKELQKGIARVEEFRFVQANGAVSKTFASTLSSMKKAYCVA
ncbi:MAG: hypothetical protein NTW74_13610 [Acidobacteria bacterium]|nr:hypothetical protein [Acidobacteriota bacterium]